MTSITRSILCTTLIGLLAGCEGRTGDSNQITDGGIDGGTLADGRANIWVSPDGCQYWYIDDGIEGYMAARLKLDGTPVCGGQETGRMPIVAKDGTIIMPEAEPRL